MITGSSPAMPGRWISTGWISRTVPIHVRARAGLGYLPQEPSIFRHLSVRENVMAILETRPGLGSTDREHRLETLLGEFHVSHLAAQRGDSLSGGERRRVEIARSLAADPRFMLLDEPFAGVDPISILDIQQIIRYLSERGIGILITDHNVRDTLGICDRAYIVNEGVIIAEGTPEAVLDDELVRDVYLGQDSGSERATVGEPALAVVQGISPPVPATTHSSSVNAAWIPASAGMTTPASMPSFPRKRESLLGTALPRRPSPSFPRKRESTRAEAAGELPYKH